MVEPAFRTMNSKPVAILLIILCLLLSASLYYRHTKAVEKGIDDQARITTLSEQVKKKEIEIREQTEVNISLDKDLQTLTEELGKVSNNLVKTSKILIKTETDAKAAEAALTAEVAKRETRINELEGERDDLTKKMADLNGSITSLEGKIDATKKKLAASEGDREFLLKELKRLQAEKSALERQFHDLAILREQVKQLKAELSVSKRLDWIRRGLYGDTKGGERMMKSLTPKPAVVKPSFDLNVELKQNPGASGKQSTNAPAVAK